MRLFKMQLQYRQSDFKKVNICSARDPSLPVWWRHSKVHSVLFCFAVSADYGRVPYSLGPFISAALLQAMLQAEMELFRNGLVETRNRAVEMRNELGTFLVPVQIFSKWSVVSLHVTFKHEIMNSIQLVFSIVKKILIFSNCGNSYLIFVIPFFTM